ncbi:MAG: hypothetical protein ACI3YC_00120 [Alloprevotella sp.]
MKTLFTHLLYIGALLAAPAFAQTSADSLQTEPEGQDDAFRHVLQKPRVSKRFDHKTWMDHAFLDGGVGLQWMGARDNLTPGIGGEVGLGDWCTPEHGWRVGVQSGYFRIHDAKTKYAGVTMDYLLNLTELASYGAPAFHRFEVIGVAGVEADYSRRQGHNDFGFGARLGLRGQLAVNDYIYVWLEPRASLVKDNVAQEYTFHRARPTASLFAGMGYRVPERMRTAPRPAEKPRRRWNDSIFISVSGGPAFLLTSMNSEWNDHAGGRIYAGLGKWFNPRSALRLSAGATLLRQPEGERLKGITAQADYLLNLHNLFGGTKLDRKWWVNAVAGVGFNWTDAERGVQNSWGVGAGLQGNARLYKGLSLTLEPRVDVYTKDFASARSTVEDFDVIPSFLVGLQYTSTVRDRKTSTSEPKPARNQKTEELLFVEAGVGANLMAGRNSFSAPWDYARPSGYLGIGHWFTGVHGVRLNGQFAQSVNRADERKKHLAIGVDYLLGLSNLIYGVNPERKLELQAAVGMNLGNVEGEHRLHYGLEGSLRGVWHLNPLLGLFVEPKLQGYNRHFLSEGLTTRKIDLIFTGLAGVQLSMNKAGRGDRTLGEEVPGDYVSLAGGAAVPANHFSDGNYYYPVGRVSYVHPFTAVSAVRLNLQGQVGKHEGIRHAEGVLGADWLADFSTYTYGLNSSRPVSLLALAGFNAGQQYFGGNTYFYADLHVGGQFSVRAGEKVRLYVEPQWGYRLFGRPTGNRWGRWSPMALLGVDYHFRRAAQKASSHPEAEKKQWASVGLGAGVYSVNFGLVSETRKLTFVSEAAYGRWLHSVHGAQISVSNTVAKRGLNGKENLTSVKLDYVLNISDLFSDTPSEDKLFRVRGLAGASLNVAAGDDKSAKWAPGAQIALQGGFRLSPAFEIFVQPEAAMYAKSIERPATSHPFEGELRLTLGTRISF